MSTKVKLPRAGAGRAPTHRSLARRSRLLGAVGVELLEIGPQVVAFVLALDAGEHHLGAGDLGLRIGDVFLEGLFVPNDAGVLVGVGIIVAFNRAGLAPIETILLGAYL